LLKVKKQKRIRKNKETSKRIKTKGTKRPETGQGPSTVWGVGCVAVGGHRTGRHIGFAY
jgi:hypothetical protein